GASSRPCPGPRADGWKARTSRPSLPSRVTSAGAAEARRYSVAVLQAAGYSPADAALCADAFVESALRGIDSHGFGSLLPRYARVALKGIVSSAIDPCIVHDGRAAVVVDGKGAPGLRAARFAAAEAIERARTYGVGAAVLRNSSYLGALWWCVIPVAE